MKSSLGSSLGISSPLLIDIVSARRCIIVRSYEGRRYDSGSLFGEKVSFSPSPSIIEGEGEKMKLSINFIHILYHHLGFHFP